MIFEATLSDLDGIKQKSVTARVFRKPEEPIKILKKYRAATSANDHGALNVWRSDDGALNCEVFRHFISLDKIKTRKESEVVKWCEKWLKFIKVGYHVKPGPVVDLKEIRRAVADYIATEGCSCCRDTEGHAEAMNRIGKLLKMKKYVDGSGFDYSLYKTKRHATKEKKQPRR